MIQNVSIIGLGAIGAAYIEKIMTIIPKEQIKVIAGGERGKRLKEQGMIINGVQHYFTVVDPEESCEPTDLLIIGVKFPMLDEAVKQSKNHVGDNTLIISLINGISSEDIIARTYGKDRILYSVNIGIDAAKEGNRVVSNNIGKTLFGEANNIEGNYSSNVLKLKELFDACGIVNEVPEDARRALWMKFMVNVGVNQTTGIFRTPYGVAKNVEEILSIILSAMREVIQVANSLDIPLSEKDLEWFLETFRNMAPNGKTSMLQDVEAERPSENMMLGEELVAIAREQGIDTPVNDMLVKVMGGIDAISRYKASLK